MRLGLGPVWSVDLGVGTVEGVGLGPESGVGVWVRRLVLVHTNVVVWSSPVRYGTRAGTSSRPTQCCHQVKLVFAATQVAPPPVVLGAVPHQHLSQHTGKCQLIEVVLQY